MKIVVRGDTLSVSGIKELATTTASSFQSELSAALRYGVKRIDLDLSQTTFVDCGGLGALVAIWKKACDSSSSVTVHLLNPPKLLQRMVNLMKMENVFPIEVPGGAPR
jgi:anti-anti-sigma factor